MARKSDREDLTEKNIALTEDLIFENSKLSNQNIKSLAGNNSMINLKHDIGN